VGRIKATSGSISASSQRMRVSHVALLSSAFVASGITLLWSKSDAALAVVPHVDLTRYQGKWYEIARLPTRFQRDCASDVTAQYTLQDDGKIEVLNACREANGKLKRAKGIARLRDKQGPNSKLKVRFFFFFSGDYWILDLDKGYKWVLVGTPNRRYLWILSRTPELNPRIYNQLIAKARELGFDVDRVIRTKQTT